MIGCMQNEDGSFKQNAWVDGRIYWNNVQMDQVSFPLILAWRLNRTDLYPALKKAGGYLLAHGPYSPQERWEENCGYSPSSIAAQLAGLVCLAELAGRVGDREAQERYLQTADSWQQKVESCASHLQAGLQIILLPRVCSTGDPNRAIIELANGCARYDEREIVDAGFWSGPFRREKADDPAIVNSLQLLTGTWEWTRPGAGLSTATPTMVTANLPPVNSTGAQAAAGSGLCSQASEGITSLLQGISLRAERL